MILLCGYCCCGFQSWSYQTTFADMKWKPQDLSSHNISWDLCFSSLSWGGLCLSFLLTAWPKFTEVWVFWEFILDRLWPYLILFLFSDRHNKSVQLIESGYIYYQSQLSVHSRDSSAVAGWNISLGYGLPSSSSFFSLAQRKIKLCLFLVHSSLGELQILLCFYQPKVIREVKGGVFHSRCWSHAHSKTL